MAIGARDFIDKLLVEKYAFDLGAVLQGQLDQFDEFLEFLWKGKRSSFCILQKESIPALSNNFNQCS